MTRAIRVALERGPKGRKVVAVAPDWPGLERGANNEAAAIERMLAYLPRYAKVATLTEMETEFPAAATAEVCERYPGSGSTDFWGISFAISDFDRQPMSDGELERELALMRASWAFFDDVRSRVSADLRKEPRGGGRNRDQIVRHTLLAEHDWAKKIGVVAPDGAAPTCMELTAYRDAYCQAIRDHHARGDMARNWPLRYLIRHTAFHTLDHAWEMEDKDLTAKPE